MKTALVTGHGLIGNALVEFLENKKIKVFQIDHKELRFTDRLNMPFDYIFHTSTYGNQQGQDDPFETLQANEGDLLKLLYLTRSIRYKAFVNFSSSSVGLNKQTEYSLTKIGGENHIEWHSHFGKPTVNVRPFSVYGYGEHESKLIPTLCRALRENKFVGLDPDPTHDWIYIDDFISGLWTVVKNIKQLSGKSIEIGTGLKCKNVNIVNKLERITGKLLKIDVFDNHREYDNDNWRCKDKTLRNLGWEPKYTLEQGLEKTYNAYEI